LAVTTLTGLPEYRESAAPRGEQLPDACRARKIELVVVCARLIGQPLATATVAFKITPPKGSWTVPDSIDLVFAHNAAPRRTQQQINMESFLVGSGATLAHQTSTLPHFILLRRTA
jgi:hypothetical protein